MKVRCKFRLNAVTERIGNKPKYEDGKHGGYEDCSLWDAEFQAVSGGTGDENSEFWKYTPSGTLKLATIERMPWQIGKEYYGDIIPVEGDEGR